MRPSKGVDGYAGTVDVREREARRRTDYSREKRFSQPSTSVSRSGFSERVAPLPARRRDCGAAPRARRVPLVRAQHRGAARPRVRVERLVRGHDEDLARACGRVDDAADHRVGVLPLDARSAQKRVRAPGRRARCGTARRRTPARPARPARCRRRRRGAPPPCGRRRAPPVRPRSRGGCCRRSGRARAGARRRRPRRRAARCRPACGRWSGAPSASAAGTALELTRVEEQTLAERAAVDVDALQPLGREIVPALRALHPVTLLELPPVLGRLLRPALGLALLAGSLGVLDQLALVLAEPFVLTRTAGLVQVRPPGRHSLGPASKSCQHRAGTCYDSTGLSGSELRALGRLGGWDDGTVPGEREHRAASFPHLLVDLYRHGATGSLKATGPAHPKALYFRGGRILFGSSNDPRDQLGSILIESGRITRQQLDEVNAKVGPGTRSPRCSPTAGS